MARLTQAALNEIPFSKRQNFVLPSKSVDGKQDNQKLVDVFQPGKMKNFKNPTTFQVHSFFISMAYFLLCLSMLRKKPFPVSKYAKDMLAYRKGNPYCFMQQTTALHEHRSKCYSMEIFNERTCQKHMRGLKHVVFFHKNTFVS